jgi:hypothetical protein
MNAKKSNGKTVSIEQLLTLAATLEKSAEIMTQVAFHARSEVIDRRNDEAHPNRRKSRPCNTNLNRLFKFWGLGLKLQPL